MWIVLFEKMKMGELILSGVTAFLVAVRWFLMLTIKQNNNKKINSQSAVNASSILRNNPFLCCSAAV